MQPLYRAEEEGQRRDNHPKRLLAKKKWAEKASELPHILKGDIEDSRNAEGSEDRAHVLPKPSPCPVGSQLSLLQVERA